MHAVRVGECIVFRIGICSLAALLLSSSAWAHAPEKMEGSVHRAARHYEEGRKRSADGIHDMARPSRRISLRALTDAEARPVSRKAGLVPVGINRQVPENAVARGEWSTSPEGNRVWRLAVDSSGAEAVRVRFTDFHAGSGTVWVLGDETAAGPYTGDGPFGDGEFWSDIVSGDSIVIAWEPAQGDTSEAAPFTPRELSHRFRSAARKDTVAKAAAATCAVDVTCKPEYAEPASAVALIIFESGNESYECSGALISSASQPALPFFATANHCVASAAEARSLISFFNYQTTDCNGTPPSLSRLPRVNGSTLVSTFPMQEGDFTLLQLSAFPNLDVKVLGWTSDPIGTSESVVGISHPLGDFKRVALGRRTRDLTIRFSDGERMPASLGYQVAWFEGVTQSGSSGSPLLVNIGGKQYLAGTLTAGPDVDEDNSAQVCRSSNLVASYGRFSAVYPSISTYLTSRSPGGMNAPVAPQQGFSASPNTLTLAAGQVTGQVTLSWSAPSNVRVVQIRVGSPTGPAMTGIEAPVGSVQTGDWVTDGMTFYLQDASDGNSLGAARTIGSVRISTSGASAIRQGSLSATPNPITSGGRATLRWEAKGVVRVQIRVGSPTGPAMTGLENPSGSAATGAWVTNGMTFYLQDASDGSSLGSTRTLASVQVQVNR